MDRFDRPLRLPLFPEPPQSERDAAAKAKAAGTIPSAPGTIKGIDLRTGLTLAGVAAGLTALFLYDPIKAMDLSVYAPKEPKLSKREQSHIDMMQQLLVPERYKYRKALEARKAAGIGAGATLPGKTGYSPTRVIEMKDDFSDDITDDFEPVGDYGDDEDEDEDDD